MVHSSPLPVRVLLVEDEEAHFEITRALLTAAERTAFDLDWARSYEEAVAAIAEGVHDIYLVDYFLEDRTGLDVIREVQRGPRQRPVIMLTGKGDRSVDLEAMRVGASDYLVKGTIDPQTLERSIRYALEAHQAKAALLAAEARNRRTFENLPVGLFRTGPEGEFLEANPALREILGYPDDDVLRSGFARDSFVAPGDTESFRSSLDAKGGIEAFESELKRVDGSTVAVRVSAWRYREEVSGAEYVEGTVELVAEKAHPASVVAGPATPRLP
ncbi:MAG: response regulator [Longimicrobiales bacterium]